MSSRHVGGSGDTGLVIVSETIKHKFCEIQVTGTYLPSLVSSTFLELQGSPGSAAAAPVQMKGHQSLRSEAPLPEEIL